MKTKKIITLFILIILSFSLSACNNNLVTHRTVEIMNETSKEDYYQSEFTNLDGRTVIKIKKDNSDGSFKCIANLSKGSITVKYRDSIKTTTTIFTINRNESVDGNYGYITSNSNGYLIIETTEISSGKIYISWN